MTMRKKEILASVVEIQNDNWGNHAFAKVCIHCFKFKAFYNYCFRPIFFLDFNIPCLLLFPHSHAHKYLAGEEAWSL